MVPTKPAGITDPGPYWSAEPATLLGQLNCAPGGITTSDAAARLTRYGINAPKPPEKFATLRLLLTQFKSPIAILLVVTAILSGFTGEPTDAVIIIAILFGSIGLGFWEERSSAKVMAELSKMIALTTTVLRDGKPVDIPVEQVVPGDIVQLKAGDLVPADCRVMESKSLNVEEAALTGESFPVGKSVQPAPADAPLSKRSSALFQGTHVVSGRATALAVVTGPRTVFGSLAQDLRGKGESGFDIGIRHFGYLLLEITAALILVIFAINIALHRPVLDVFLFSLALAVGLTPQLLPAIVSITLAHGARAMAAKKVLVRRLVAIEDFGGMTVLCTDKTGTLTEGVVKVQGTPRFSGKDDAEVRRLAYINAALQTGFDNPIDEAIVGDQKLDISSVKYIDEVPYDFNRRLLSVLVDDPQRGRILITKGALKEVLAACTQAEADDGSLVDIAAARPAIEQQYQSAAEAGVRCLALAYRKCPDTAAVSLALESQLVYVGLIELADTPKADIKATLARLTALGLSIKMITGDNRLVAAAIAQKVGLPDVSVVSGAEIQQAKDAGLRQLVMQANVFAEIDPNQKERIIRALRASGITVGYMGDGINDAPALQAADVGISVDTAVEVTREAADIVLLRKDLGVLADGIAEGRRAFANTLKYIFITTSANFGNMFSMAGASLMAAFLPMLPKQILLLNMLSDIPAMTISTDRLDPELVARPRKWDMRYIRNFMIIFGLLSSAFDFLTFYVLRLMNPPEAQFRTAWFIESMLTEVLILLVIRTARPFYRSPPSAPLLWVSGVCTAITLALPYIPGTAVLGFAPLPLTLFAAVVGVSLGLVTASEIAKHWFFKREGVGT